MPYSFDLNTQTYFLIAAGMLGVVFVFLLWHLQRTRTQGGVLRLRLEQLQQHQRESLLRNESLQDELSETKGNLIQAQTRLEQQQQWMQEKEEFFHQTRESMQAQFKVLAQDIFDEKGRTFKHDNKAGLGEILEPFRNQLQEFRHRIDDIHVTDLKDRTTIRHELEQLRTTSHQLNKEAVNLTRALKGENKLQGNWGEMVLERVLEQSGLRKGHEYMTQVSLRNAENQLLRPDVVVLMPEGRNIIIDSKVSLTAYERYCSAEELSTKEQALKQHVHAVRQHINDLGSKDYADLYGGKSLDFVLMFMPLEPAFICAIQHAEDLLDLALNNRVIVVTPTTLLATMRTVENIWRYERQNQNARAIAARAGAVYDKLRGFVEDMEKIGVQISTLEQQYHSAMNKLTQGKGNLVSQASRFVELGVKVKRKMPDSVLEYAETEIEAEVAEEI
ncbi:MAG: DNA recombination protein RmuC [Desulfuromonadaceae bacterium]|nr:DNA recombination protein RmuC [Desulfuromonadaceae bacterium]